MIPLFAITLPVIVLFCGLSLDVGLLEYKKLQMQNAADAGAIGAELEWERNTGLWTTAGQQDASVNGFTNGTNGVTVTVIQVPTSGSYAGDYDAIQVTIAQSVKTIFMGALNGGQMTVSAQAVSLIPPCLVIQGKSALVPTYAVNLANASTVTSSCPMYVNKGIGVGLNSTLSATAENLTGASSSSVLLGTATPTPRYSAAAMSDPLASIAAPTPGACTYIAYIVLLSVTTMNPGTYCNGISITTSIVTLNPGLYIITGGANWAASTVQGTGVTLYFTHGGLFGYGQFIVDLGSTVTLSAPTSTANGGIPSILVFGDRSWVPTSPEDFQCVNSTFKGDGIWYTTNTGIYLNACNMSGTNYLGMVTDSLSLIGASNLTLSDNYSSIATGNPLRTQQVLVQ